MRVDEDPAEAALTQLDNRSSVASRKGAASDERRYEAESSDHENTPDHACAVWFMGILSQWLTFAC